MAGQRMPRPLSRVREYRKSSLLVQRELAALIGFNTQQACSELESGAKRPGLEVAFACAVALGAPLEELFPHLALHIERELLARANALLNTLRSDAGRSDAAAYVSALIKRLTDNLEL